jgi:site-specific recombinase XerD
MLPPIRAIMERRRDTVEAERPSYTHNHDLVWCHPSGAPIDPRDDWRDWSDLLTAAGVPHVTLHEARNTAATLLLEGKVDAKVIGAILGHSQIATTRGYQTVTVELAKQALEGYADRLELA